MAKIPAKSTNFTREGLHRISSAMQKSTMLAAGIATASPAGLLRTAQADCTELGLTGQLFAELGWAGGRRSAAAGPDL